MKIALCGAHSTGKTTLFRACQCALDHEDITFIEEVARQVIAAGLPLNQDATVEAYSCFIEKQLRAERLAVTKHVIADRCVLDVLAYMYANRAPHIPVHFQNMVEELVQWEQRVFDVVCYLPPEVELALDDVRPADRTYRSTVDKQYGCIFQKLDIKHMVVKGEISERVRLIRQVLGV